MARTIVNKHFENKEIVTREQFHENDLYAKGEIIIVNDETPSIYVLDADGNPKQISGGNSSTGGDVSPEVIEQIKNEITSGYTAADNVLRDEMKKADEELKKSISGVNDEFKNEFNKEIEKLKVVDFNINQRITGVETSVLEHTVNGIQIKENPVLNASDLGVGDYGGLVIEKTAEECVIPSDTIQLALKKIENMNIASVLALSAAVNNLNKRLEEALERIEQLENGSIEQ